MLSTVATISDPEVEPIDLVMTKRFLRIDGDAQDTDVAMLIAAARRNLEQTTGQRLIEQKVRLHADAFSDLASLPVGPVTSISAITYLNAGEDRSLDLATVSLTGLGLERGIVCKRGNSWPATEGPIVVDLVVGYGTGADAVPQNLRHAVLVLLRGLFDDRPVDIEPLIVNERIYG